MDSRRHRCIALLVLLSLAWVGCVYAHAPSRLSIAPDQVRETRPVPPIDRDTILFESFEGNWPPTDWAILHEGVSTTWEQDNLWPHSGEYGAWMNYGLEDEQQDEYLVSEAIDLRGYTSARLSFFEGQLKWPGFGEHHYVGVSTTSQTDPAAFTWLVDWRPGNDPMLP